MRLSANSQKNSSETALLSGYFFSSGKKKISEAEKRCFNDAQRFSANVQRWLSTDVAVSKC